MKPAFEHSNLDQSSDSSLKAMKVGEIESTEDKSPSTSKDLNKTTNWYDNYTALLYNSDSDDEDLTKAIKASLEEQNMAIQLSLEESDKEKSTPVTNPLKVIENFVTTNILPAIDEKSITLIINRKNVRSITF